MTSANLSIIPKSQARKRPLTPQWDKVELLREWISNQNPTNSAIILALQSILTYGTPFLLDVMAKTVFLSDSDGFRV